MRRPGETASDLAERMPERSYEVAAPSPRTGLLFARLTHSTGDRPFEGGLTPRDDILSLHLSAFDGRAWRDGRLIHDGPIRARSISLVKSGIQSDVVLQGDIDIIQVFIPRQATGALAAELLGQPAEPVIHGWADDPVLESLVLAGARAASSGEPSDVLAADSLALEVAAHLVARHCNERVPDRFYRGGLSPLQLRFLIDYMEARLTSELPLEELASLVDLSPFHFLRAFRAETGLTPHHWLLRRRIARAKELLGGTGLSLAEVAVEVGYSSQSAMTAVFRRVVGATPGEWRREIG